MYVEMRNIFKQYGSFRASDNVNFAIEKGKLVALLGPSGSGKTTILRMIAGLETPSFGDIYIDGKRVNDIPASKRGIGFVFQNYALFPHMTVFNNVAYGLTIKKVPKPEIQERVMEMLRLVQLEGFEKRKPDELSGGQKQRVAIARALVNKPKVLLLDEPLGALDLKLRKQMQIELKRLQKKLGITFIYVTHDQEEALTMSDRIAVMHDGVLEQLDVPMEIYEHPKTKFVAGFIGESNIFDGKVTDKKDNVLTVQTEAGMMQVCGADFEVGEEMHVAIRPEYMDVSKTPVEGFDLPGTVKDFIYQGTVVKTALDIKNGQEIKYSRFEQDTDIAEGNQVYVYWRPEKAVAIKKSM